MTKIERRSKSARRETSRLRRRRDIHQTNRGMNKKKKKKEKLNKNRSDRWTILEKASCVSSILPVSHASRRSPVHRTHPVCTPGSRRSYLTEKFRCVYAWMSFPARGNRRRGAIGGSKLAREAVSPRGCGGAAGFVRWGGRRLIEGEAAAALSRNVGRRGNVVGEVGEGRRASGRSGMARRARGRRCCPCRGR